MEQYHGCFRISKKEFDTIILYICWPKRSHFQMLWHSHLLQCVTLWEENCWFVGKTEWFNNDHRYFVPVMLTQSHYTPFHWDTMTKFFFIYLKAQFETNFLPTGRTRYTETFSTSNKESFNTVLYLGNVYLFYYIVFSIRLGLHKKSCPKRSFSDLFLLDILVHPDIKIKHWLGPPSWVKKRPD